MQDAIRRFGRIGIAYILLGTAVWAVLLIILPMLLMVDQSLRPFLPRAEWGGPKDVYSLRNFLTVVADPFNRNIFLKTIWASVIVTAVTLAVSYPIAYLLARAGRAGWVGLFMLALMIPFWINEVLRTFAWQLLLARYGLFNFILVDVLGLLDSPFQFLNWDVGVMVGLVYAYLLFMIFPLYNAMESLDPNQIDAARDLGAPLWRIHWDVVVPHAKPGLASGCIVVFMLSAGSFVVPILLGGTRSMWFTQLIYNQFDAINWNLGAAYGLSLVILCLVFVLVMMAVFRVSLKDIAR